LQNLKVDKAAGPDMIKPIILEELRYEILDKVSLIFQKIPKYWSTSLRMDKGKCSPPVQKR
jgi:hypothetical protein